MEERTLELLEFHRILDMAAAECVSGEARRHAAAWRPTADAAQIDKWLRETEEAVQCLAEETNPPFAGLRDVDALITRAQKESVLTSEDCLQLVSSLESYRGIAACLADMQKNGGELFALSSQLVLFPQLQQRLRETFDEHGQIRDSATPRLSRLRREISRLQEKIKSSLEALAHRKDTEKYLQESLVTIRNDRYVIPVKAEYRHSVPGIVHDRSATGQTLYIEPMVSVELNNDLQESVMAEHEEVIRVLREITRLVAEAGDELRHNARIASYLDFVFARARLAARMHAVQAGRSAGQSVNMRSMRHPLLPPEQVVPISLHVGDTFRILVITGSNTGGKTVAIKTLGLLAAMNQAGFFVPAQAGSTLPLFQHIWAAIGDNQSLAENLSTFSGHMKRVIQIVEQASAQDLVLLDELGTGTDPFEGAALAIAVLDDFVGKGVLALVTTHYSEVKQYVQLHEAMENAHVEFDTVSLRPTYRLHIGVAGNSQALNITRRLGMPEPILRRAEALRKASAYYDMERLVEQLNVQQKELAGLREAAAEELTKARLSHREWDKRNEEIKEHRRDILTKARDDAHRMKRELRVETERIIKQLKQAAKDGEHAQETFTRARRAVENISVPQSQERARIPTRKLTVGSTVYLDALGKLGTIEEVQGRRCQVRVDGMVVTVPAARCFYPLERERVAPGRPKQPVGKRHVQPQVHAVSNELNIIGETVADAEIQIERFLDAALVSGLREVDIIHGKGTGALRKGVHALLRRHRAVEAFRLADSVQGGSGVTVVTLRQ